MVIEIEQETTDRLVEQALALGKRPEDLARELLRASLATRLPPDAQTGLDGWVRDACGNRLGLDGLSWREMAHEGHDR